MNADLENIIVGLISAVIFAVLGWLADRARKWVQRRRAMRRHPVDGTYASSYTDEIDGVERVIRDQVTIKQHGLQFTGFSRNLETGRGFRLRGQITEERYLTGTYGGEHRADGASGMFFMGLDLLETGRIQGLWAGFGAESGSILSGKWSWRKLDTIDITMSDLSDASRPLAAALLNDSLGSGFVTVAELDELAGSDDGMVLLARGSDRQLVGVATAKVMDAQAKQELATKLAQAGVRRINLSDTKVGILKSAAVVSTARGRGIGLQLVNERLARLKELGCSTALVLAWDSGSRHSSLGVLQAAGFMRVAELPEYWREPEGQTTFECVKCGVPCVCSAVVLRRGLYDLTSRSSPGGRRRLT